MDLKCFNTVAGSLVLTLAPVLCAADAPGNTIEAPDILRLDVFRLGQKGPELSKGGSWNTCAALDVMTAAASRSICVSA